MEEFDLKIFAERLKFLRIEKNIGQNLLSQELGISNASISYWENAKQEPSIAVLYKLAVYFDVSADYLLGLED